MIIYLAGNGRKAEKSTVLLKEQNKNWGVLLSYKDIQTKTDKINSRFQNLINLKNDQ